MNIVQLVNWIITFLKNTNPLVVTGFTVTTALVTVWNLFTTMWGSLFAKIDAMVVGASSGSLSFSPLGLIDYIFPMTELLNFIVAYAGIRLACASVRIVKSFVPTIA